MRHREDQTRTASILMVLENTAYEFYQIYTFLVKMKQEILSSSKNMKFKRFYLFNYTSFPTNHVSLSRVISILSYKIGPTSI